MNFISWRPPDTGRTAIRPELNATPVASETAGENIYLFRGREMKRSHVKSQSWVSSKEYLTQDSWSCQLISTEPGSHCGVWANPPEHDIHLSAVRLWATLMCSDHHWSFLRGNPECRWSETSATAREG